MFEDLRRSFREALDNFKTELNRDEIPDTVDALLRGMQREAAECQAYVHRLESEIEKVTESAGSQSKQADVCRRREKMARDIGDEETSEVARSFAEKHERHHQVLIEKRAVLEEELALKRSEFDDMITKIKEARGSRDSLTATASRAGARQTLNESDDLFAELDRMEEKIREMDAQAGAAEEIGYEFGGLGESPVSGPRTSDFLDEADLEANDLDARLAELKRQMGDD